MKSMMNAAVRASAPRLVVSDSLRLELAHAERFARTLDALESRENSDPFEAVDHVEEPAHVWLRGRSSEVRAFAAEVSRAWMVGEHDEDEAAAAIEGYLESLHASLRPWYGEWYAPSCCGPCGAEAGTPPSGTRKAVRRRLDSQSDTASHASFSGLRPITRTTPAMALPLLKREA